MVGRQNADIADTLQLRDVAIATTFWLSMGYNFSYMIASDMPFDPMVGFRDKLSIENIAEIEGLRDVATATHFGDYISCKWTLAEANDMRLSYKGWFVFSQPLRLLVALSGFLVAAIGTAPGGRLSGWELTR